MIWWHKYVLRHEQSWSRVTVPIFDMFARGLWIQCSCGRNWAK